MLTSINIGDTAAVPTRSTNEAAAAAAAVTTTTTITTMAATTIMEETAMERHLEERLPLKPRSARARDRVVEPPGATIVDLRWAETTTDVSRVACLGLDRWLIVQC